MPQSPLDTRAPGRSYGREHSHIAIPVPGLVTPLRRPGQGGGVQGQANGEKVGHFSVFGVFYACGENGWWAMGILGFLTSQHREFLESSKKSCDAIADAMKTEDVGASFSAVQHLILQYYGDVRAQAVKSFRSANWAANFGFVVLIATITFVFVIDWHFRAHKSDSPGIIGVGTIGLIGGGVAEFIAAVQFWLYARATRQFAAFHICLERTHRYLLAYSMAKTITNDRDAALEKIVCIMANAPMITRQDIEGENDLSSIISTGKSKERPGISQPA